MRQPTLGEAASRRRQTGVVRGERLPAIQAVPGAPQVISAQAILVTAARIRDSHCVQLEERRLRALP